MRNGPKGNRRDEIGQSHMYRGHSPDSHEAVIGSMQPLKNRETGSTTKGILDSRPLPDPGFALQWDSIVVDDEQKNRLLCQAVLCFTLRAQLDRARLPLHGLIVLVGPPGTGKTSLARGLATRTAEALSALGRFRYLEVEPHMLASSGLGRSQQAVKHLLAETIAEQAGLGPLIVLLDEVETLATDRSRLSLEANPIDVHRATDALLAGLDQLAADYPQLLFLATSNFVSAIDAAFLSRADRVETIGLPGPEACKAILQDTVEALAQRWPSLTGILAAPEFESAATLCAGLDGRQIRKAVAAAFTFDKRTALDPGRLTGQDILRAVEHAHPRADTQASAGAP